MKTTKKEKKMENQKENNNEQPKPRKAGKFGLPAMMLAAGMTVATLVVPLVTTACDTGTNGGGKTIGGDDKPVHVHNLDGVPVEYNDEHIEYGWAITQDATQGNIASGRAEHIGRKYAVRQCADSDCGEWVPADRDLYPPQGKDDYIYPGDPKYAPDHPVDGPTTKNFEYGETINWETGEVTNAVTGQVTLNNISPTVNIDTLAKITREFGNGGIIAGTRVAGTGNGDAFDVIGNGNDNLLRALSTQAKSLHNAIGDDPADKLTALKNAENTMRGTNGRNVVQYLTDLEAGRTAIVGDLLSNLTTQQQAVYDAYILGTRLISRDWNTMGDNTVSAVQGAIIDFNRCLTDAGESTSTGACPSIGRGIDPALLNIGSGTPNYIKTTLKGKVQKLVVAALVAKGVTAVDACNNYATQLTNQFEDIEELSAFVDDLTAEGLTEALTYVVPGFVASAAP